VPHLYSDVFVRFVTSRQLSDNPSLWYLTTPTRRMWSGTP